jgi:putative ABC transport system permease protein
MLIRRIEHRARTKGWRQLLEDLIQDVRITLRMLLKQPGFAAATIATIAIGIGANTAMFCVANGVLIQPLPVREPHTLVQPTAISPRGSASSVSIPNFRDWRESNRAFEYFGLNANRRQTLTGGDNPEMIGVRWILGDFFEALGVTPALGRWITAAETEVGSAPTAVLTNALWQRTFGSDPEIIGKPISLDGESFTVVGVMPESFVFPTAATGVFVPMGFFAERMCWEIRDCSMGSWAIGRLGDGVTIEAAQADMDRVTRQIAELEGQPVATTLLVPLSQSMVGGVAAQIWVLMGAVALVLLIACANVGSLLLTRGESRRREIGVRTALGAGRLRVARQLLTESLVLATVGGAVGLGLGYAGIRALMPFVAQNVPSSVVSNITMDLSVLLFVLCVTTLAGLLFGLAPALRASRANLASDLREGTRDTASKGRQGIRSTLVVLEVALTLILLIGAGLMMQSLNKLQSVDKGFVAENVFTANVFLPARRYSDKEQTWDFYRDLLERIKTLPGATSASVSNTVPLAGASWTWDIWPDGIATENETARSVLFHMVSPGHFEVMGIPLLQGRGFDTGDRDGNQRVAIIDELSASEFWPGEDPIGKRLTFETEDDTDETDRVYRTVVGLVKTVRHDQLSNPSNMQIYVPMDQSLHAWSRAMVVAVKTVGDPLAMTELVRHELAALDPQIPLARIQSMDGYVQNALSSTLVVGGLLSVFSTAALVLAAVGLFGLISYSVAQQFREIGIRMALGAESAGTVRMVASRGLKLTMLGVGLGICGAYVLTRLMDNMLFGVDPVEPVTYAGLSAFLLAVAILAAYLPARRVTKIDPAFVLRDE